MLESQKNHALRGVYASILGPQAFLISFRRDKSQRGRCFFQPKLLFLNNLITPDVGTLPVQFVAKSVRMSRNGFWESKSPWVRFIGPVWASDFNSHNAWRIPAISAWVTERWPPSCVWRCGLLPHILIAGRWASTVLCFVTVWPRFFHFHRGSCFCRRFLGR
jgi:hypothetical protein